MPNYFILLGLLPKGNYNLSCINFLSIMVENTQSRKDADHKNQIITPKVYFSQKHKTNLIWFCFVHILQRGIKPWHALLYSSLPHLPSLEMMAEGFALSHTQTSFPAVWHNLHTHFLTNYRLPGCYYR